MASCTMSMYDGVILLLLVPGVAEADVAEAGVAEAGAFFFFFLDALAGAAEGERSFLLTCPPPSLCLVLVGLEEGVAPVGVVRARGVLDAVLVVLRPAGDEVAAVAFCCSGGLAPSPLVMPFLLEPGGSFFLRFSCNRDEEAAGE